MKILKFIIVLICTLLSASCRTTDLIKVQKNSNYIVKLNYLHEGTSEPFYEREPKSKEELIDGQLYLLELLDSSVSEIKMESLEKAKNTTDSLTLLQTIDSLYLMLKKPKSDRIKQINETDFLLSPMKFDIYSKLYLDAETIIQDYSRYLKVFQKNKVSHGVFLQSASYNNKIYYYEEETKNSLVIDSLINIKLDKSQTVVFNGMEGNPYTITEKGSYYGSPTIIIHEGIAKLDFPMRFNDHINIGFIYDNNLNGLILKNDRYLINKDTKFEKELEHSIQLFSYEILNKKDWSLKKIVQNKYPNINIDSIHMSPENQPNLYYNFDK
ncbi:hypothetical protein [Nonlabens sp.]|uniref:hypothetical protein n=1 Tax=Nonlabens sp. TaxID=1888209 RepID=UPI003F69ECE3